MTIFTKTVSLSLSCFLVVVFGYQIRLIADIDSLLALPAPSAGTHRAAKREPTREVVSNLAMDDLMVEFLGAIPANKTRNYENVGYLSYNLTRGEYAISGPEAVKVVSRRKTIYSRITLPVDKNVVALFHDHTQDTLPGPGAGDGGPVFRGLVSYVKDERGSIYKIEFSERWKTPQNNNNGWRLTTLQGRDLPGQELWRPGIIFTRYVRAGSQTIIR